MMSAEEAAEAAKGLTFEKVWATIEKLAEKQEETSRNIDSMVKKSELRQAETSRNIDSMREDTKLWLAEMRRIVKRLSKNIGGVNNSLGKWVEKMVSARLWEKFNAVGYVFTKGGPCELIEDNRVLTQVDVFLENGEYAMPVEVKTDLTIEDIDEHLERIEKIRRYMDKRNDKRKLVGAAAGAIVPDNVLNYAFKKGLYVLVQSGKSVALAERPENFKVREW
ncbi:MAG: hypothetical protein LBQ35_01205 [Spirochaetaceae bacterium]|nr:hypothetical protein [Spirochaetaceae bacterium]